MSSNYHTDFKENKVTAGKPAALRSAGASVAMPEKSDPFPGLPGKAQPRNRAMGVKKIKTYNQSDGL